MTDDKTPYERAMQAAEIAAEKEAAGLTAEAAEYRRRAAEWQRRGDLEQARRDLEEADKRLEAPSITERDLIRRNMAESRVRNWRRKPAPGLAAGECRGSVLASAADTIAVILHRFDPSRNVRRFYRLEVLPDLFGCWLLLREWGRIGWSGQRRVASFATVGEAHEALQRHRRAKEGRGCDRCRAAHLPLSVTPR